MQGELDEFRYSFSQLGLDKTGFNEETQYVTFRAIDGVAGRFYQIVLNDKTGEERAWSFTDSGDLVPMINKFVEWSNRIDEM